MFDQYEVKLSEWIILQFIDHHSVKNNISQLLYIVQIGRKIHATYIQFSHSCEPKHEQ